MRPVEEVILGLTMVYERGPRTQARRDQLMRVVACVLDYFIPVEQA